MCERRIFLVDDNPDIRRIVAAILDRTGFQVSCFESARECLEEILRQPCHLLITDIEMPDMNGLTLIRQVRHSLPLLPVLVISAAGEVPIRAEIMSTGEVAFLRKPFCRDRLLASIDNVLQ